MSVKYVKEGSKNKTLTKKTESSDATFKSDIDSIVAMIDDLAVPCEEGMYEYSLKELNRIVAAAKDWISYVSRASKSKDGTTLY